jgi:hypothetical protein
MTKDTPAVQDFSLKYDNTVLLIYVYVRAHQDIGKLQKEVFRAAKGPQLDAMVAWSSILLPAGAKQELEMEQQLSATKRDEIEKWLAVSTDEVLAIRMIVNTDSDPWKLSENIKRAARGPRLDAVLCLVVQYAGEDGRKVWDLIQTTVQQAAADPRGKPFSL